jgi:hypothetical protein
MRASIEFEVYGSTLSSIKEEALRSWREISENDEVDLPSDTEFHIEAHSAHEYKAIVYVRTKVDEIE